MFVVFFNAKIITVRELNKRKNFVTFLNAFLITIKKIRPDFASIMVCEISEKTFLFDKVTRK